MVKVKVTWRNVRFEYELTCLEKEAVSRVIPDAVENAPSVLKGSLGNTEFVVALSCDDLGLFGVTQKPSKSVVFVKGEDAS